MDENERISIFYYVTFGLNLSLKICVGYTHYTDHIYQVS